MKDLVASIAVGKIGDKIVCDLDGDEEHFEGGSTDIATAILPNTGEVTLLQLDGEVSAKELGEALKLAQKTAKQIYDIQKQALKEKFNAGEA